MTKPQNARQIAAQVLEQILENKSYSNIALSNALNKSGLTPQDKGFATELLYGTLRWLMPIEQALLKKAKKLDSEIKFDLLIAAYQIQYLQTSVPTYAAVDSCVENIKNNKNINKFKNKTLVNFSNAFLKNLIKSSPSPEYLETNIKNSSNKKILPAFGFQKFFYKALKPLKNSEKQNQIYQALLALNTRPDLYFRIFDPKSQNSQDLVSKSTPHYFLPDCYKIKSAGNPESWPGFDDGNFYIQDPASQIPALLLGTGERVLDMCAAPGGKSIILAKNLNQNSELTCNDINQKKLEIIKENLDKYAPNKNFKIINYDATQILEHRPEFENYFDKILLDAPCSSLGTVRKHPEIKIKRSYQDVLDSAELQKKLLDQAANLLKPGGHLVYSVCSPMPEEGELMTQNFLDQNPNFKIISAREILSFLPENSITESGAIATWPHLHDCDAFFAICLKKD